MGGKETGETVMGNETYRRLNMAGMSFDLSGLTEDHFEAARISALGEVMQKQARLDEEAIHQPGAKDDSGKLLAAILGDFPHALESVATVGTYGAHKYTRHGWETVPDGLQRYSDAFWRHLLKSCYEDNDPESGLSHAWHALWNLMAMVELGARQAHGV